MLISGFLDLEIKRKEETSWGIEKESVYINWELREKEKEVDKDDGFQCTSWKRSVKKPWGERGSCLSAVRTSVIFFLLALINQR